MITALTGLSCFAQKVEEIPLLEANVDAAWGPIKKSRTGVSDQLVGFDGEGGYYTYEYTKRATLFNMQGESAIRHYDSKFLLKKEVPLRIEGEKWVSFTAFYPNNDKIFLFTTQYIYKEKRQIMRVQTFDKQLNALEEPRIVGELSEKVNDRGSAARISSNSSLFGSTLSIAGLELITSRKETKVLLFKNYTFDHIFKSEDKNEKYELTMLDGSNGMKEMWKQKVEMPYESAAFEILDGCLDEAGNFYMMGVLYPEKRKTWDAGGRPNYEFKLFKFNASGKVFETELKVEDKFLTDLKLDISANGKLICTGFYSKDRKTTTVNGIYYLSLDSENGKVKKESFKEFELDMLTENLSERKAKKIEKRLEKGKDVNLYQFTFDELIPRTDGGAVIVAEQYYWFTTTTTTTSSTGAVTMRTNYHYRYNDILVINVTPEGDIDWAHKIHKMQRTTNDGGFYSSYAFVNGGKELFFIYNDNGRNTLEKEPKDYKAFIGPTKGANVVTATVNKEGKVERKQLFKARRKDTIIRPKNNLQISQNSILIQAVKGKKSQFVRLDFK